MRMAKAVALLLIFSLFAASFGLTGAYLSAHPQTLSNVVTAGSVKVDLQEPAWNPERAAELLPGAVVAKNPTAVNTGRSEAWIFLRLSVPMRNISLVDGQSKRKQAPALTELFAFQANENWELIERRESSDKADYVYGYRSLVQPRASTAPLFTEVQLVNYLEGELTREDLLKMPLEAVAVQDHTCPEGASLAEIYHVYLAQEEKT